MSSLIDKFVSYCNESSVDLIASVPDGYLAPLIKNVQDSKMIHISAAREEECFGIASGAVMSGKRAMIMVQNSGFLNSIGCFATLCMNYKLPMVILVAHRGNFFDRNGYDTEKYRYFEDFLKQTSCFTVSWHAYKDEGNIIERAFQHAEAASEPVILSLDFSPTEEVAC